MVGAILNGPEIEGDSPFKNGYGFAMPGTTFVIFNSLNFDVFFKLGLEDSFLKDLSSETL